MSTINTVSYYPPNNNLPITPFFFDKYYIDDSDLKKDDEPLFYTDSYLQTQAVSDGVAVGRYIYVHSTNNNGIKYSVYQKIIQSNTITDETTNTTTTTTTYKYQLIAKLDSILVQGQVYWNDINLEQSTPIEEEE